jgi:hypothetical protein
MGSQGLIAAETFSQSKCDACLIAGRKSPDEYIEAYTAEFREDDNTPHANTMAHKVYNEVMKIRVFDSKTDPKEEAQILKDPKLK